mmetsp:Transcript_90030/g.275612  ORF Transcript_90030/g.275612 Transcript_90030/m.275612 type:complete len:254 (+) Transcript_90030:2535-3296(+)
MVLHAIDDPIRQVGSCKTLALHGLVIEKGQRQKSVNFLQSRLGDHVRIERLDLVDEAIRVGHHFLRGLPIDLLPLVLQQESARSAHVDALHGRLAEPLQLADRVLVKAVHRLRGRRHGRHGLLEFPVSLGLQRGRVVREGRRLRLLVVRHRLLLRCDGRGLRHLVDEDRGGRLLLLHLHHGDLQVLLQTLHLRLDLFHDRQAALQAVTIPDHVVLLVGQHLQIKIDQLQEGLGRRVVVAALFGQELPVRSVDR